MIIRSIIFYSCEQTKKKAINIAKLLNGYVDVEDLTKENPHIDMKQFFNVIIINQNEEDLVKNIILKYNLNSSNKCIYLIDNLDSYKKLLNYYYFDAFADDISISKIINTNSKKYL